VSGSGEYICSPILLDISFVPTVNELMPPERPLVAGLGMLRRISE